MNNEIEKIENVFAQLNLSVLTSAGFVYRRSKLSMVDLYFAGYL